MGIDNSTKLSLCFTSKIVGLFQMRLSNKIEKKLISTLFPYWERTIILTCMSLPEKDSWITASNILMQEKGFLPGMQTPKHLSGLGP